MKGEEPTYIISGSKTISLTVAAAVTVVPVMVTHYSSPRGERSLSENLKQARVYGCIHDSARAVTIVFTDKHAGQQRCQRVPAGQLPINTRAFSLTWRLIPDRKTETKREHERKHKERNPVL